MMLPVLSREAALRVERSAVNQERRYLRAQVATAQTARTDEQRDTALSILFGYLTDKIVEHEEKNSGC